MKTRKRMAHAEIEVDGRLYRMKFSPGGDLQVRRKREHGDGVWIPGPALVRFFNRQRVGELPGL